MDNGAAGVNVGKRVEVTGAIKAACKVGSMVGVDAGVGVDGESKIGKLPDFFIFIKGAYTHATEFGTPG